jgi:hypothetical protein
MTSYLAERSEFDATRLWSLLVSTQAVIGPTWRYAL